MWASFAFLRGFRLRFCVGFVCVFAWASFAFLRGLHLRFCVGFVCVSAWASFAFLRGLRLRSCVGFVCVFTLLTIGFRATVVLSLLLPSSFLSPSLSLSLYPLLLSYLNESNTSPTITVTIAIMHVIHSACINSILLCCSRSCNFLTNLPTTCIYHICDHCNNVCLTSTCILFLLLSPRGGIIPSCSRSMQPPALTLATSFIYE